MTWVVGYGAFELGCVGGLFALETGVSSFSFGESHAGDLWLLYDVSKNTDDVMPNDWSRSRCTCRTRCLN